MLGGFAVRNPKPQNAHGLARVAKNIKDYKKHLIWKVASHCARAVGENAKIKGSPRSFQRLSGEELRVEQAGSGLEKIVVQSLRLAPRAEAPLMAWPVVCGSAVAERTRALTFQEGVLRVEVTGQRWKAELQILAPRYLAMINRYTIEPVLRIEFVIARAEGADKISR